MTREQGLSMVARYRDVEPRDVKLFLEWLGMGEKEFWPLIYKHRSVIAWKKLSNGQFELTDAIAPTLTKENNGCEFLTTRTRDPNPVEDKYFLLGRGWVDSELGPQS
jgi:hypothetical protein